ncbi:MAG: polysaccharide biosynthesis tyrosine autokinase, partial [Candidatus Eisenbacteria bacterium]|nr:polysaccharide biosynthesis tyrosine autokinase [Candidatus Eisenbacteria bacterium]
LTKADVYQSSAEILIDIPEIQASPWELAIGGKKVRSIDFYKAILESQPFLKKVAQKAYEDELSSETSNLTLDAALFRVMGRIDFVAQRHEGFYSLSCVANDPDEAFALADAAKDVFQEQCNELVRQDSQKLVDYVTDQIEAVSEQLAQSTHDLEMFQRQLGEVRLEENQTVVSELASYQQRQSEAANQKATVRGELASVRGQYLELDARIRPSGPTGNSRLSQLQNQLAQIDTDLERLRLTREPDDPEVRQLRRDREKIARSVVQESMTGSSSGMNPAAAASWQQLQERVAQLEGELDKLERQERFYRNEITRFQREHPDLFRQTIELARLRRVVDTHNKAINFLVEEREKARIKGATETAGIKVIDNPRRPVAPLPSRTKTYILFGAVIGILLGVGSAYALEYFDNSIRTAEEVQRSVSLPVLGTIPQIRTGTRGATGTYAGNVFGIGEGAGTGDDTLKMSEKIVTHFAPKDPISEAYRSLRTNIQFARLDKPIRSMLVSSAGPKEGKSLSVINLATTFAQMGEKTLVVDADMRRPTQHHLFGIDRDPGLTTLLSRQDMTLRDVIRGTEVENLFVIPGGSSAPNPAELLGSPRMEALIAEMMSEFGMVVFDTPPVVAVTDAALLSRKVDGALLVCRWGQTDRHLLMHAADLMRKVGASMIGVLMNNIDVYHRYGSYGHYYHYYYYSSDAKTGASA